jgi:hypothetical protein
MNQRWLHKRGSFVSDTEIIDPREFEVIELRKHAEAKRFVETHHYSGSCPTVIRCFGLLQGRTLQSLVGVAIFSRPMSDSALTRFFPGSADEALELGRFVLLDCIKSNAETFFLSRCFKTLRKDLRGVVSFSDPHPRKAESGETVFVGQCRACYEQPNRRVTEQAPPIRNELPALDALIGHLQRTSLELKQLGDDMRLIQGVAHREGDAVMILVMEKLLKKYALLS